MKNLIFFQFLGDDKLKFVLPACPTKIKPERTGIERG